MFPTSTYLQRRQALRAAMGDATILLIGHRMVPRNYPQNTFPFRQNSHVLYYCGISRPDVALVMTPDGDALFGPPEDIDDVVWHGPHETLDEAASKAGITDVRDIAGLGNWLKAANGVRYLTPYQDNVLNWMAELSGRSAAEVAAGQCGDLAASICSQRSIKTEEEVAEIEEALSVTRAMHLASYRATRPGVKESDVAAAVQQVALSQDRAQSYNPIITVRGEVLHNNDYHNTLEAGQLMLNDSGAESRNWYASDITRCCPVGGSFSDKQRAIYDVVLRSQLEAIDAIAPGVPYKDVHLTSARVIAEGLTAVGLMKGDPADAVAQGAHALFFPHGVGHMLGLDVHDMEDLGDVVGYQPGVARSDQFGLNFLRLAKPLEPGFVVTVEPGIYFIPALIDRWKTEGHLAEFIDYDAVETYKGFGGIRIEDDVLCTQAGSRVLGPAIPKEASEVEAAMAG